MTNANSDQANSGTWLPTKLSLTTEWKVQSNYIALPEDNFIRSDPAPNTTTLKQVLQGRGAHVTQAARQLVQDRPITAKTPMILQCNVSVAPYT